jgi:hypothetical protein
MRAHETDEAIAFVDGQYEIFAGGAIYEQSFGIRFQIVEFVVAGRDFFPRIEREQGFDRARGTGVIGSDVILLGAIAGFFYEERDANGNPEGLPFSITDVAVGQEPDAPGNTFILPGGPVEENRTGLTGADEAPGTGIEQMIVDWRKMLMT